MRPLQPNGFVLAVAAKLQAVLALPVLDGLCLSHSDYQMSVEEVGLRAWVGALSATS